MYSFLDTIACFISQNVSWIRVFIKLVDNKYKDKRIVKEQRSSSYGTLPLKWTNWIYAFKWLIDFTKTFTEDFTWVITLYSWLSFVISTSLISNNCLSRSENLVPA